MESAGARPFAKPGLRGRARTLALAAGALLAAPAALGAPLPPVSTEAYVVAVAPLSGPGVGAEAMPFLSNLPRLLAAGLSTLPPRFESEAYRAEAAAKVADRARFAAGAALAARLDELALRSLEPGVEPGRRAASVAEARRRADEAAKALAAVEEAIAAGRDPGAAPSGAAPSGALAAKASAPTGSQAGTAAGASTGGLPPGARPASLWEGHTEGRLYEAEAAATTAAPASLRAKGISLLVGGRARPVGDYLALDIEGYDPLLERNLFSWRVYANPADPGTLARELAGRVETFVADRTFARLEIAADPAAAYLIADGRLLPEEERILYRFEPGLLSLRAAAPGRKTEALELELGLGERRDVSFSLEPAATGRVSVVTEPPDASLAVNGLPAGAAPAALELQGRRSVLAVSAPGRETTQAVLPASGQAEIRVALLPEDGLGPGGRVEKAQRGFYGALGLLVLSLPATSILYGVNNQYYEAATRSWDPNLVQAYNGSLTGLRIAAAASVLLAANAIYRLAAYIDAAR
ncbi:MAG: hypothetical protein JNG85_09035 [Spirochaetaceae bacterium]|nr:hypothetical protein [Spirochaetaceae bacterium]